MKRLDRKRCPSDRISDFPDISYRHDFGNIRIIECRVHGGQASAAGVAILKSFAVVRGGPFELTLEECQFARQRVPLGEQIREAYLKVCRY
jgi:hypothetical protein